MIKASSLRRRVRVAERKTLGIDLSRSMTSTTASTRSIGRMHVAMATLTEQAGESIRELIKNYTL